VELLEAQPILRISVAIRRLAAEIDELDLAHGAAEKARTEALEFLN
jgi:hypothetical protein